MHKLPSSTVKLISSTQVITSVYSAVKELVENSLDAGADSIDIRLENSGLDKIEVQDNGSGITCADIEYLCKPHYTSKIKDDSDLLNLLSYGFRGEALHSLCTVADITVITKTKDDFVSQIYTFDKLGDIIERKPTHHNIGSIISIRNLFKDIPVRRQVYKKPRKLKDELYRVQQLLMSYGLLQPKLRLTLTNDKNPIWRKERTSDYVYTHAINEILGKAVGDNLSELDYDEHNFKIKLFVPKPNCNIELITRGISDHVFIFVNDRPVMLKEMKMLIKRSFNKSQPPLGINRWPVAVIYITVKPDLVDVNLEPNKTCVLLLNMDEILEKIKSMLEALYDKSQLVEDILLDEITTQEMEPGSNTPIIYSNNCSENEVGLLSSTGNPMTGTVSDSTEELSDEFFKDLDSTEHLNCETSQIDNSSVQTLSSSTDISCNQVHEITDHLVMDVSHTADQGGIGPLFKHTEFIGDELTQQNHEYNLSNKELNLPNKESNLPNKESNLPNRENEETIDSQVSEIDMEEWSRGINICTPVRVLQPQDILKDSSNTKRKQADEESRTIKKAKRISSVSPLLEGQRKLKEAGMFVKKLDNCENVNCTFELERIKNEFGNRKAESSVINIVQAIGRVHERNSLWTVLIGHKLFIVDNARLTEKLVYEKLLREHKFKTEKLEKAVSLTRENIGEVNFDHLCELKDEISLDDCVGRAISHPSLIENGIHIKRSTDAKSKEETMEWTHGAVKIHYNLDDIIEILEGMEKREENFRPNKVKDWCKKEAKRLSQVSPEVCTPGQLRDNILELKKQSTQENFEVESCLHHRPIMLPLRSIKFL